MRRVLLAVTAAAFLLAATRPARAGFIGTMSIYGVESGTFQGQVFHNALVTFSATYDTDNVTETITPISGHPELLGPITWKASSAAATVTVAGVGSASIAGPGFVETTSNRDASGVLHMAPPGAFNLGFPELNNTASGKLFFTLISVGAYSDRDLIHSSGPTQQLYDGPLPPVGTKVNTSTGDLVFTEQIGVADWTAQVDVVPEPSSFTLLGVCGAGLLGYAWRRRKLAVRLA